ncbi:unnamed protein product [Onchocerca flexuosa]|uniref:Uncharacterized protein n=1 Tax=Onchocerca flexuosa TaxID=387005 RepID=A0A183HNF7_9BILA|nr:unnamed protein product [Onchocerca flexuosa]
MLSFGNVERGQKGNRNNKVENSGCSKKKKMLNIPRQNWWELFIIFVYFFHIHHLPIIILLFFLRRRNIKCLESIENRSKSILESDEEPDAFDTNEQSSSSSIRERFNTLQDTMAKVQNTMDFIASLLERIRK